MNEQAKTRDAAPVCSCGQRDAERYPDATDRVLVPTDAACPLHGGVAANERRWDLIAIGLILLALAAGIAYLVFGTAT